MNILIEGNKSNLCARRYPWLRVAILVLLIIVIWRVECGKYSLTEGLDESLVIGFLSDINDEQPVKACWLFGPVFFWHGEFNSASD